MSRGKSETHDLLSFRSLRSGSSGNMLLLERRRGRKLTRLLIDCGISSQRRCLQILESEAGLSEPLSGLLVTHANSDHINYAALRVIDRLGIPVYVHEKTRREILTRYLNPYRIPTSVDFSGLELRCFNHQPFKVDGLEITPIPVPHAPGVTTHAFAIRSGGRRLLLASDFNDPDAVVPHIYNCDLVYLEANYDPQLLRQHFNPASLFHMANPAAGLLLNHALSESKDRPQTIVLGHLSEERNRPELALETVRLALTDLRDGRPRPRILAAPRYAAGDTLHLESG